MRAARLSLVTAILTAATPALAAGREDTSGIFVWAFLGLCALIVAAQVIPALLMLVGAARGLARGLKEAQGEEAEARTR
ncbi:MAG: hypothetical protein IH608_10090 [Proteobacteria bacterium]|nr:hypothetical protein [Pseudomonadota bacterium]